MYISVNELIALASKRDGSNIMDILSSKDLSDFICLAIAGGVDAVILDRHNKKGTAGCFGTGTLSSKLLKKD